MMDKFILEKREIKDVINIEPDLLKVQLLLLFRSGKFGFLVKGSLSIKENQPLTDYAIEYDEFSVEALLDRGQGFGKFKMDSDEKMHALRKIQGLPNSEVLSFSVLEELSQRADKWFTDQRKEISSSDILHS